MILRKFWEKLKIGLRQSLAPILPLPRHQRQQPEPARAPPPAHHPHKTIPKADHPPRGLPKAHMREDWEDLLVWRL